MFLLFKGIDIFSGEGVIKFLVGHFEKGSSDFYYVQVISILPCADKTLYFAKFSI